MIEIKKNGNVVGKLDEHMNLVDCSDRTLERFMFNLHLRGVKTTLGGRDGDQKWYGTKTVKPVDAQGTVVLLLEQEGYEI